MDNRISLNELNYAIDRCRDGIEDTDLMDYHFLEFASQELVKKSKIEKKPVYLKYFPQEKALSIVLDFFKSLGVQEWYERARSILYMHNRNIGINIYDYSNIKNSRVVDHNGISMYSPGCCIESKIDPSGHRIIKNPIPKSLIKIPKNTRYTRLINTFPKDQMNIEDINSTVHEIVHSFYLSNDWDIIRKKDMIEEILPFCFERMLEDYFIENNVADRPIIESLKHNRTMDILNHSRFVYTVINLMEMQENDGIITKQGIDDFLRENNIYDIDYVRDSFMDVIESDYDLGFHARYLIAGLTSARFYEHFKKDRNGSLENVRSYCQRVQEGDIDEETLKLIDYPDDDKKIIEAVDYFTDYSKGSR